MQYWYTFDPPFVEGIDPSVVPGEEEGNEALILPEEQEPDGCSHQAGCNLETRVEPLWSLEVVPWIVPVGGSLEHQELLDLVGDGWNDLDCAGTGPDDRHPPGIQVTILVPLCTVETLPFE